MAHMLMSHALEDEFGTGGDGADAIDADADADDADAGGEATTMKVSRGNEG